MFSCRAMGSTGLLYLLSVAVLLSVSLVQAEDAYKYFTWTVTYGTLSPLGSPQQVCYVLYLDIKNFCFSLDELDL